MPREPSASLVRRAGRGFASLLAAKLYFLVTGYTVIVVLSWVLGPVLYGVYGIVLGVIQLLETVVVASTVQGVSRYTAEHRERAGMVKAAGLRMQALLGGGIALGFALVAPLVAAFERDPGLTPYLRVSAGVVLCYALYAVFVGSLNGLRRFGRQAGLDALFATVRSGLVLGLALAGLAVWGAVAGFLASSVVILVAAVFVVGVRDLRSGFPLSRLFRFVLPVMGYHFLVNLVLVADLFLLKRYAGEALAGLPDPAASGGEAVGVYVAAGHLGRLTFQALLAVTFVVFPLVSETTHAEDVTTTRRYVGTTLRYSLLLAALLALFMAALPGPVLGVPYGPAFRAGAPALALLAVGYAFFALYDVATTILNAAGRPGTALVLTAITLAVEVLGCRILVPRAETPEGVMTAAAAAACGAMALGWILSMAALRRALGAPLGLLSLLRVGLAFAAAAALGQILPEGSRPVTVLECLLVGVAFLAFLLVSRELGREDLRRLGSILGLGR